MAPREETPSTLPGLWKYPTYRDHPLKSSELWLRGREEDDGAEGLWRIHDDLYDLTPWIRNHPGGAEWLTMTKGTDITEAFESHHLTQTAERLLPQFIVRRATSRRNSPYTFHEDGFYKTLKRRVRDILKKSPSGPTFESKLIADLLCSGMLITAILAAGLNSYFIGIVSGVLLAFTVICAHNFFHQRDNFRMYYFDLCLMSSRDWRISHALSHHLYPNTLLDLEISLFEPMMQWLPHKKSFFARFGSWFYSPIVYSIMFHYQLIMKMFLVMKGHWRVLRKEHLVPFIVPTVMYLYGGSSVGQTIWMWSWIIVVGSFFFGLIGINGGHHEPGIFHDGDAARIDRDWGLNQLDAVRDRKEISTNLFLVLTNFGHHGLHHLFPTVDHGRLNQLYPVLEATCAEFGVDYSHFKSTVMVCLKGQFLQLAREEANPVPPSQDKPKAS